MLPPLLQFLSAATIAMRIGIPYLVTDSRLGRSEVFKTLGYTARALKIKINQDT